MKVMVDISLYPFKEDYVKEILDFIANLDDGTSRRKTDSRIENLKKDNDILIQTNAMSTQISGDYDKVFNLLQDKIKSQFEKDKAIFVIKVTNGC